MAAPRQLPIKDAMTLYVTRPSERARRLPRGWRQQRLAQLVFGPAPDELSGWLSGRERLAVAVGPEFAALLLDVVVEPQGRLGSSSP